jgi:hypothetical protein
MFESLQFNFSRSGRLRISVLVARASCETFRQPIAWPILMKDEYDFSKGERGKFFRSGVVLNPPTHVYVELWALLTSRAQDPRLSPSGPRIAPGDGRWLGTIQIMEPVRTRHAPAFLVDSSGLPANN